MNFLSKIVLLYYFAVFTFSYFHAMNVKEFSSQLPRKRLMLKYFFSIFTCLSFLSPKRTTITLSTVITYELSEFKDDKKNSHGFMFVV